VPRFLVASYRPSLRFLLDEPKNLGGRNEPFPSMAILREPLVHLALKVVGLAKDRLWHKPERRDRVRIRCPDLT
jgi:hypothetical protein